jgi:hypothetical protein
VRLVGFLDQALREFQDRTHRSENGRDRNQSRRLLSGRPRPRPGADALLQEMLLAMEGSWRRPTTTTLAQATWHSIELDGLVDVHGMRSQALDEQKTRSPLHLPLSGMTKSGQYNAIKTEDDPSQLPGLSIGDSQVVNGGLDEPSDKPPSKLMQVPMALADLIMALAGLIMTLAGLIMTLADLIMTLAGLIMTLADLIMTLADLIMTLAGLIMTLAGLIMTLADLIMTLAGLSMALAGLVTT